jgi:acetamidase/formamidase
VAKAHLGSDKLHYTWSREQPPALTVRPGDEVELHLTDASGGQLGPNSTIDDFRNLNHAITMPISGPIVVDGARPGDVLQVDLLSIDVGSHGWTGQRPGQGILTADEFPDEWVQIWHIDGPRARYRSGVSIPLEPFPGMIAVAPGVEGRLNTDPPRRWGGNLDAKHLVEGTRVFLPVEVEGALLGIGDGHAAQGDGEVCGSAIEVAMTVVARVDVRRDFRIDTLQYEVTRPLERASAAAAGYHVTTGVSPDLYSAARDAVRAMVRLVSDRYGLAPQDAYGLCSVAGDLKISEIVDWPNMLVSFYLPKDVFDA